MLEGESKIACTNLLNQLPGVRCRRQRCDLRDFALTPPSKSPIHTARHFQGRSYSAIVTHRMRATTQRPETAAGRWCDGCLVRCRPSGRCTSVHIQHHFVHHSAIRLSITQAPKFIEKQRKNYMTLGWRDTHELLSPGSKAPVPRPMLCSAILVCLSI